MDIEIDSFNDLDLTSGDLRIVKAADAVSQHLRIRLRFIRGEWFLDLRIGIPYFSDILIKAINLMSVRGIYAEVIRKTPGVISLGDLALEFDRSARILGVPFSALLDGEDTPREFDEELIL